MHGRHLESAAGSDHEQNCENGFAREPAGERPECERQRGAGVDGLANAQHRWAVETVSDLADQQRQRDERQELREPDQTEIERAAGQVVDLPADPDRQRHIGGHGKYPRAPEHHERTVRGELRLGCDQGFGGIRHEAARLSALQGPATGRSTQCRFASRISRRTARDSVQTARVRRGVAEIAVGPHQDQPFAVVAVDVAVLVHKRVIALPHPNDAIGLHRAGMTLVQLRQFRAAKRQQREVRPAVQIEQAARRAG